MRLFNFVLIALFSCNSFSSNLDLINNILLSDKSVFTQTSLNEMTNSIQVSEGKISRINNTIFINISSPFKEKYSITDSYIEINDLEFNQIKTIEIETLPNKEIINILKFGFKKDNISEISNGSLALDIDERPLIIKLISDDSFSIDYLDNLNILNTILFKELK